MDDLISRAAAIEYRMTNMGWRDEDGYEVDDADEKRAIITDLVNGMPAVDAVPVVRCKDCKYSYFASNRVPDEQCLVCGKHGIDVTDDWFCADDERRESE